MSLQIFDCEQGSEEWLQCRLGIPTASNFKLVLAKGEGKVRKQYMFKLAGEIITGKPAEGYQSAAMLRGQEMEAEAREWYAFTRDVEVSRVGFLRNGQMGASPDFLCNADGGAEFKTAEPHILIEQLLRGDVPPEHVAQVQGSMLVSERDWWDVVIYWPGMTPPVFRAKPDRPYQANLRGEIDRFNDELAEIVEKVRAYGQ